MIYPSRTFETFKIDSCSVPVAFAHFHNHFATQIQPPLASLFTCPVIRYWEHLVIGTDLSNRVPFALSDWIPVSSCLSAVRPDSSACISSDELNHPFPLIVSVHVHVHELIDSNSPEASCSLRRLFNLWLYIWWLPLTPKSSRIPIICF